jgi:hypothetical protein
MRSGTRRVADSKPDAPVTSKDDDTIPMSQIGEEKLFKSSLEYGGFLKISFESIVGTCSSFSVKPPLL